MAPTGGKGGSEQAGAIWMTDSFSSTTSATGPSKFNPQITVNKTNKTTDNRTNNGNQTTDEQEKEGLPMDLLKYLSVDQSIEDIARFIDLFPTLQPKYSQTGGGDQVTASPGPRWILSGCSYGGNLAAWTQQRYPSKVFAAFASSAPVRSTLDFFEYSTSQTDILGDKCSTQLGFARDFLDGALQMTDDFMQQMSANDLEEQDKGDCLSPSSSSSTSNPVPIDGDDKALRQAAKLRVLTWFSPDFAREYAAEGEKVHAAGWVWWMVASAVQYNAIVTPITVRPTKTAVDILCDAMEQAKVNDSTTGNNNSNNNNSSSNTARNQQLRSLRYTKALAAWFKDLQYFTPTKQEDLQPSDLDPVSVQNLAGMAWLWQTCSELGYLQTAHPSTCCCPALVQNPSNPTPDSIKDFSSYTIDAHGLEYGNVSNYGTCPLISLESSFSSTFARFTSSSFPSQAASTNSTPPSTNTGQTCLPCRCYADESQRSESVFSRLLTLETSWQECQFYFSSTHPPARNPAPKTTPSSKETTAVNADAPLDLNSSLEATAACQEETGHPGSQGDIRRSATTTNNSGTRQQKRDALLMGYPDVETNVNTKFHGWEIVQDPCYPAGSTDSEKGFENDNARFDKIHFTSSSSTTTRSFGGLDSGPPSSNPDAAGGVEQDNVMMAHDDSTRRRTDLDDWLLDHPGGRYYFTNGDKDPWKELTLASSRALEFLSRPKAGGSERDSVKIGGKKRNRNIVQSKHSVVRAEPAESTEAALPASTETEQGGPTIAGPTSLDILEDNEGGNPESAESATFLPDSKIEMTSSAIQRQHHRHHHLDKHHHVRRHRHHHRHRYHHHHHHHRHKHHPRKHHSQHHRHRHHSKHRRPHSPCLHSIVDPYQSGAFLTPTARSSIGSVLPQPKLSGQEEDIADGDSGGGLGSGPDATVLDEDDSNGEEDEDDDEDDEEEEEEERMLLGGNNEPRMLVGDDEIGDRTVMRIISDTSHCQDILYESSDHYLVKVRQEREHVLKTFVRWIEIDNRRWQRVLERQQRKESAAATAANAAKTKGEGEEQ
ncbi:hypothetical protein BGX23_005509 [Mortierella sp. AD031]|nr:hypothetical protein BGX23_005509 [Mortierella sp. AD031]